MLFLTLTQTLFFFKLLALYSHFTSPCLESVSFELGQDCGVWTQHWGSAVPTVCVHGARVRISCCPTLSTCSADNNDTSALRQPVLRPFRVTELASIQARVTTGRRLSRYCDSDSGPFLGILPALATLWPLFLTPCRAWRLADFPTGARCETHTGARGEHKTGVYPSWTTHRRLVVDNHTQALVMNPTQYTQEFSHHEPHTGV